MYINLKRHYELLRHEFRGLQDAKSENTRLRVANARTEALASRQSALGEAEETWLELAERAEEADTLK